MAPLRHAQRIAIAATDCATSISSPAVATDDCRLFASARAKNLFVKILGEVRDRYGFALAGYVVMPNHIHLLISEPAKGTPSTVMQVLKQRVSRRLRRKPRQRAILTTTRDFRFRDSQRSLAAILAVPLLRFQRLESNQVRREASLHAHESREEKTRRSSQGLAVEQFFVLLEERTGLDSHRSHALRPSRESNVKSPALQKASRTGHPNFKLKGRATRRFSPCAPF